MRVSDYMAERDPEEQIVLYAYLKSETDPAASVLYEGKTGDIPDKYHEMEVKESGWLAARNIPYIDVSVTG